MVRFLLIVLITFAVNLTSTAQDRQSKKDSLSKIGFITDLSPVGIYIIDGLEISKVKHDSLNLSILKYDGIKVRGLDSPQAIKRYGEAGKDGAFLIETQMLYILNGRWLEMNEKRTVLSSISQDSIVTFTFINSHELLSLYNRKNKYGAFKLDIK